MGFWVGDWLREFVVMVFVVGWFVVVRSFFLESNVLVGNEMLCVVVVVLVECIGIFVGCLCFVVLLWECFYFWMVVVVWGCWFCVFVIEFVIEEFEVLDVEEVEEVVEEEEENFLIFSVFEVLVFYVFFYGNFFFVFVFFLWMVCFVFGIGFSGELISGELYLYRFKIFLCRFVMRYWIFLRCRWK